MERFKLKNIKKIQPSTRELEVLETLWKADKALSATEIVELSPDRTWKESTIHILLKSLEKKSLIKVDGFSQTTTNIAKMFSPSLTANEFLASRVSDSNISKCSPKGCGFKSHHQYQYRKNRFIMRVFDMIHIEELLTGDFYMYFFAYIN